MDNLGFWLYTNMAVTDYMHPMENGQELSKLQLAATDSGEPIAKGQEIYKLNLAATDFS